MADVLILTYDNSGPSHALYLPDQAVTDGVKLTINGTYDALESKDVSYAHMLAGTLSLTHAIETPRGHLFTDIESSGLEFGDTVGATLHLPAISNASRVTTTAYVDTSFDKAFEIDWQAAASSYAYDFGAGELSRFTSTLTYSFMDHTLDWTEMAGALVPDSIHVVNAGGTRSSHVWLWTLFAPYTKGKVTFPTLPIAGFDYNLRDSDTQGAAIVELAKVPGGYDAVRQGIEGPYGQFVKGDAGHLAYAISN
jgi:hypothetical protein